MTTRRPFTQYLLGAGALAVVLSGCGSGISVTNDWDPGVDFSAYSTFAVLDEATGGSGIDQLIQNRIKSSIASTLVGKGMRQVDSADDADAAVGWQLTTEQRSSFQTVTTGWGGYGYGRGGWYGGAGMGMSSSRTTERRYQVGSLAIGIFDVKRDEMIFTSTGSKELSSGNLSPEESQKRIDEAVALILEEFPPGSD
ncbi:MAG: DUF4136 domain-containing protein [Gemmatimonadetes bacterium]|jgi:hypothetical protein|nr:DUF4136 domain-containing protein [Gemmatimonadota bacterium]